jgi:hypothetical protein
MTPTWTQQTANEVAKIDSLASGGLSGTADSLSYRIHEMERHAHSWERWMAVAASANAEIHVADRIGPTATTAFKIDAGTSTWGEWLQILGSSDTPVVSGGIKYDIHRLSIVAAEAATTTYFIQIAFGTSGAQALTDNTFSSLIYRTSSAQNREAPLFVQHRRALAGTKAWARCMAVGKDTCTLDFFFGLHEYEG